MKEMTPPPPKLPPGGYYFLQRSHKIFPWKVSTREWDLPMRKSATRDTKRRLAGNVSSSFNNLDHALAIAEDVFILLKKLISCNFVKQFSWF